MIAAPSMTHEPSATRLTFAHALWAMPACYAVHICEEWFGGFPRYIVEEMHGFPMPRALFFVNNALFMTILLTLCAWASRRASRLSAVVLMAYASANLFWNFAVHLLFTVSTGRFSPGLVTGTLLYFPIPLLVTALAVREGLLTLRTAAAAFSIGAALMAFVLWAGVYHFAV